MVSDLHATYFHSAETNLFAAMLIIALYCGSFEVDLAAQFLRRAVVVVVTYSLAVQSA